MGRVLLPAGHSPALKKKAITAKATAKLNGALLNTIREKRPLDEIKKLLKKGADPNCRWCDVDQDTALLMAAEAGDLSAMKVLLEAKANPKFKSRGGWSPLARVLLWNNSVLRLRAVGLLEEHGVKISAKDRKTAQNNSKKLQGHLKREGQRNLASAIAGTGF